jgi:magnesium transporter
MVVISGAAIIAGSIRTFFATMGRTHPMLFAIITVMMAKSIGCFLPLVAKKLKVDPAIMAAPLITTIIDGASLAVYFSIAKILFKL